MYVQMSNTYGGHTLQQIDEMAFNAKKSIFFLIEMNNFPEEKVSLKVFKCYQKLNFLIFV